MLRSISYYSYVPGRWLFPNLEKTTSMATPIHFALGVGMWPEERPMANSVFNNLKFVQAGDEQEIKEFHPRLPRLVTQRIVCNRRRKSHTYPI